MAETKPGMVTRILQSVADGRSTPASELLPLLYSELRALAGSLMAKLPPGNTLQPTALVHEAYVRLIGDTDPGWDGKGHFFAAAAEAMRRILVEQARRKGRFKHGGGQKRLDADEMELAIASPSEDVLALDEALERLTKRHPRKGQVVMLRYFAGLTIEETAEALGVSQATVERDWRFAKVFLFDQLGRSGTGE